jgi:hypothetical protein
MKIEFLKALADELNNSAKGLFNAEIIERVNYEYIGISFPCYDTIGYSTLHIEKDFIIFDHDGVKRKLLLADPKEFDPARMVSAIHQMVKDEIALGLMKASANE